MKQMIAISAMLMNIKNSAVIVIIYQNIQQNMDWNRTLVLIYHIAFQHAQIAIIVRHISMVQQKQPLNIVRIARIRPVKSMDIKIHFTALGIGIGMMPRVAMIIYPYHPYTSSPNHMQHMV